MINPFSLEGAVLCLLIRRPSIAASLSQEIEALHPHLRPSPGALYPAVKRLAERGMTKGRELPPEPTGGRPRVLYSLTPKGRREATVVARIYSSLAKELA